MTPVIAFLLLDDNRRQVCLGCSEILNEKGMLDIIEEFPLNGHEPEYSVIVYRIADGFTLAECQVAIAERHIGAPWGQ